jgi:hypothetical protein
MWSGEISAHAGDDGVEGIGRNAALTSDAHIALKVLDVVELVRNIRLHEHGVVRGALLYAALIRSRVGRCQIVVGLRVRVDVRIDDQFEQLARGHHGDTLSSEIVVDVVAVLAQKLERVRMVVLDGLRHVDDVRIVIVVAEKRKGDVMYRPYWGTTLQILGWQVNSQRFYWEAQYSKRWEFTCQPNTVKPG